MHIKSSNKLRLWHRQRGYRACNAHSTAYYCFHSDSSHICKVEVGRYTRNCRLDLGAYRRSSFTELFFIIILGQWRRLLQSKFFGSMPVLCFRNKWRIFSLHFLRRVFESSVESSHFYEFPFERYTEKTGNQ